MLLKAFMINEISFPEETLQDVAFARVYYIAKNSEAPTPVQRRSNAGPTPVLAR